MPTEYDPPAEPVVSIDSTDRPDPSGSEYVILAQDESTRDSVWIHGGESTTRQALMAATDLSDMSDELAELGASWPAICDCGRERGHILRGLELRSHHRALEVGAGCGGVTRFLTERCGSVDALEPNPERARLAARRLAGLPSARVIVGGVKDLAHEAMYDVIVLIGVLEYIGGWRGVDERISFLRDLTERLHPGGHIVCAIENRLGVGYFAGQPEDHSGILFQGIEDHPRPAAARTFARTELESIFRSASLFPTTLGVFPDYRFPRLIFEQELLDSTARPLAWRVPRFPSPPHPSYQAAKILDERRVWRSLVENGMGAEFPNSFLVVAGRDDEQQLWPKCQLATFYSVGRRRRFATESRVIADGQNIAIERSALDTSLDSHEDTSTQLVHRCHTESYVDGEELMDILVDADETELRHWLVRYHEFVDREVSHSNDIPFDIWPENILVVDGELTTIDTEFTHRAMRREDVLWRGLLLLAIQLSERTASERWSSTTPRQLVAELGRLAGIADEIPIENAVRCQAELTAEIFGGKPGSETFDKRLAEAHIDLEQRLDRPLSMNVYDSRDAAAGMFESVLSAHSSVEPSKEKRTDGDASELQRRLLEEQGQSTMLAAQVDELHRQIEEVRHSRSWRLTAPMRRLRAMGK